MHSKTSLLPTGSSFSLDSKPLIAVVGPTATGKSELALEIARSFESEIVNGDSRLVYRHMDIGVSKPSPLERSLLRHHLVDLIDADEHYSLALYLEQARQAMEDIHNRGKVPILVGGTGQYIWSLLEGFQAPKVPPNYSLRAQLEAKANEQGHNALWQRLKEIDATAATRIDPRNVRRVIRALEVYYDTGIPFSEAQKREPPPYHSLILGLSLERQRLYQRIDQRVDDMVEQGWLEEVSRLLAMGYSPGLPSMSSLGYREMIAHLREELPLQDAISRTKTATHRFARHQHAWFRMEDARIHWLNAESPEVMNHAKQFISVHLSASGQPMVQSK